ncbi:unnamed protein product [Amoebophrya sp. A25]|nr:unnamed protein product [Amoebophrya sp. A25]|eukprot:GSA25T00006090001.1
MALAVPQHRTGMIFDPNVNVMSEPQDVGLVDVEVDSSGFLHHRGLEGPPADTTLPHGAASFLQRSWFFGPSSKVSKHGGQSEQQLQYAKKSMADEFQMSVSTHFLVCLSIFGAAVCLLALGRRGTFILRFLIGASLALTLMLGFPQMISLVMTALHVHTPWGVLLFWLVPIAAVGVVIMFCCKNKILFVAGMVAGYFVSTPVLGLVVWLLEKYAMHKYNHAEFHWFELVPLFVYLSVMIACGFVAHCIFHKMEPFIFSVFVSCLATSALAEMTICWSMWAGMNSSIGQAKGLSRDEFLSQIQVSTIHENIFSEPLWHAMTVFSWRLPMPLIPLRSMYVYANLERKEWLKHGVDHGHKAKKFALYILEKYEEPFPMLDGLLAWSVFLVVEAIMLYIAYAGLRLCCKDICFPGFAQVASQSRKTRKTAAGPQDGESDEMDFLVLSDEDEGGVAKDAEMASVMNHLQSAAGVKASQRGSRGQASATMVRDEDMPADAAVPDGDMAADAAVPDGDMAADAAVPDGDMAADSGTLGEDIGAPERAEE